MVSVREIRIGSRITPATAARCKRRLLPFMCIKKQCDEHRFINRHGERAVRSSAYGWNNVGPR